MRRGDGVLVKWTCARHDAIAATAYDTQDYIKSQETDGWTPLATIAAFKKMVSYTTDLDVIRSALKASDALDLDEKGENLKRRYVTPDKDPNKERIVHASGFGVDGGKKVAVCIGRRKLFDELPGLDVAPLFVRFDKRRFVGAALDAFRLPSGRSEEARHAGSFIIQPLTDTSDGPVFPALFYVFHHRGEDGFGG